mgnify:CR=1 FL=1
MTTSNDFTRDTLLGPDGVYEEFIKGDYHGHVFRGNQHSVGGIVHFDPYNAMFTTTCASGHQNTIKVPQQWIGRNPDGSYNGQFASGGQDRSCSTCNRPLANRWRLVAGRKKLPAPPNQASPTQDWTAIFSMTPKNYVQ